MSKDFLFGYFKTTKHATILQKLTTSETANKIILPVIKLIVSK